MVNLASTFWSQERWKEAEDPEVQVIDMRERVLRYDHLYTLTAMGNLAFTLKSQCRSEKAISLMDRWLRLRKRILGDHHPDITSSIKL
ncbi:hypothetical protein yc1106_02193 [Curvularia clavata]|uniref:Uncharacterized protein n=1 Tax=Curvularia clavata TaxID=95742 RepID=A0A9Q9DQP8_CURCL|nr:hypothetical protein yc1106_02193 [Curvularia clavata]